MQSKIIQMLQMMDRPAFCVCDGIITGANQAALGRMVCIGEPVAPLLVTGKAEYEGFEGNWLYLTISPGGIPCPASVRQVDEFHIFTMEPERSFAEFQVLALAAQELRIPLAQAMLSADRLLPDLNLPEDSPAAQQAAWINRRLTQMYRIILNMADAARYTGSTAALEIQDVNAVVQELFEQAVPLCEAAGVHLQFTGLPAPVHSLLNAEQMERGLYNILSNALKHTPAGGCVNASLTKRGNTLYLTVADTGSGIDPQKMGDVFNRFQREPSVNDSAQGLGLGMTLIRSCANTHGGTVLLSTSPETGCKITMSLPIRLDSSQLSSPQMRIDYAGDRHHGLIELSDSLPYELYKP